MYIKEFGLLKSLAIGIVIATILYFLDQLHVFDH